MDIVFLLGAEADVQTAYNRFEEWQEGRGLFFLQSVEAAVSLLRRHPEAGPHYEGDYRRLLLPQLPFGLFYTLQPRRVLVVAVMDLRQSPRAIRRRLSNG